MQRVNRSLFVLGVAIVLLVTALTAAGTHTARIDNRIVEPYGLQVVYHVPIVVGYEPVPTPVHCGEGAPTPAEVAVYSEDFEGDHGYSFVDTPLGPSTAWNPAPNLWHVTTTPGAGSDAGHEGSKRLWFGRESTGTYNGGHPAGVAKSPPIDLPLVGSAVLVWDAKWQVEWLKGYDHLWVELEGSDGRVHLLCTANAVDRADPNGVNGGSFWQSCSPNLATPCSQNGLAYTPMGWETRMIEIPPTMMGDTVRVRFTFDSSDGAANWFMGWMVDNVRILGVDAVE